MKPILAKLGLISLLLLAADGHALIKYWVGTYEGGMSTPGNWVPEGAPVYGDTLRFVADGQVPGGVAIERRVIYYDPANPVLKRLEFLDGGYVLSSGGQGLQVGGEILVHHDAGTTTFLTSVLDSAGSAANPATVIKRGRGRLFFSSGTNAFTGDLLVQGGQVEGKPATAFGAADQGRVILGDSGSTDSAIVTLSGPSTTFHRALVVMPGGKRVLRATENLINIRWSGTVTGSGDLTIQNQGNSTPFIVYDVDLTGSVANAGSGTAGIHIPVLGGNLQALVQNSATSTFAVSSLPLQDRTVAVRNNGGAPLTVSVTGGYEGSRLRLENETSVNDAIQMRVGFNPVRGTVVNAGTGTGRVLVRGAFVGGARIVQSSPSSRMLLRNPTVSGPGLVVTDSSGGGITIDSTNGFGDLFVNNTPPSNNAGGVTLSGALMGIQDLVLKNNSARDSGIRVTATVNHAGKVINAGSGTGSVVLSGIGASITEVVQSSPTSPLQLTGAYGSTGFLSVRKGVVTSTAATQVANNIRLGDSSGSDSARLTLRGILNGRNVALDSGTTGKLILEFSGNTTINGSMTGNNDLTLRTSGAHSARFNGGSFGINGVLTNEGPGTVAIEVPLGPNVPAVEQAGSGALTLDHLVMGAEGTIVRNVGADTASITVRKTTGTGDLLIENNGGAASEVRLAGAPGEIGHAGRVVNNGTGAGFTAVEGLGATVTGLEQRSATSPLRLTGINRHSGPTLLQAGPLVLEQDSSLGDGGAANTLVFAGGTLVANTALHSARKVALQDTAFLEVAAGKAVSFDGSIAGPAGLVKKGTGSLTLAGGSGSDSIGGTLRIEQGTFVLQRTLRLKGDFDNAATFSQPGGELVLDGTLSQTLRGNATTFGSLVIDNAQGVQIASTSTVTGTLTFGKGVLSTGANTLILDSTALVMNAGAGRYVEGNLAKRFSGTTPSFTYPLGQGGSYRPLSVAFKGASPVTGSLLATTHRDDTAGLGGSKLDPSNSVKGLWRLTPVDLGGYDSYDVVAAWPAADLGAGATPLEYIVRRFDGTSWTTPTIGSRSAGAAQAVGLNAFGDFRVGSAAPPLTLRYALEAPVYARGGAITANEPSLTGGDQGLKFSLASGALPAGLALDSLTGAISGAPTVWGVFNAVVRASNAGGFAERALVITVPGFRYAVNAAVLARGVGMTPADPQDVAGTGGAYSVAPALPSGVSLDATTGRISGTPTVLQGATRHTITRAFTGATVTDTLNLTVIDVAPTVTYADTTLLWRVDEAAAAHLKVASTGFITRYSIAPAPPAGVVFDTLDGRFSGTPTEVSALTAYVVTAHGPGGTGSDTVKLATLAVAPKLALPAALDSLHLVLDASIDSLSTAPANSGGRIVRWSLGPGTNGQSLTANTGLVFDTATGRVTGTATVASPLQAYVLRAHGLGGTQDSVILRIAVEEPSSIDGGSFAFRVTGRAGRYGLRLERFQKSAKVVTVNIYGVHGRTVWSQRVDFRKPDAKASALAWDGRDHRGMWVPAGMYTVRVSVFDGEKGSSSAATLSVKR